MSRTQASQPKLPLQNRLARHALRLKEEAQALVAILAGPIVVTTIVTIVGFQIKDAWGRNRLR
jgi:hypothetical protein